MYVQFSRTGISNHDLVALESQISRVDSCLVVNWSWQSYSHNARYTGYYWLVLCINDMWDHLCVFFCIFLMSFILYIARTGSWITVVVWHRRNRLGQWQCDFHLRAALPLGGAPRRRHIANRSAGPSIIMHCGLAQPRDSTDVGRANFPVWEKMLCELCAIFCFVYNCQFCFVYSCLVVCFWCF